MNPFEFTVRTRVVFGLGAVDRTGALAKELGATRAFLVTDPGIVAAGHVERVEASLAGAGLVVRRFDSVRENPTTRDVADCAAALGEWPADVLIGVGGGSSIDVAKGCAFVRAGGGSMDDYHGVGKARGVLSPIIAIPTTAGTGSEVQSFALIGQDDTHQKMACGDPQAAPRVAVLDPALTVSQPRGVTAATGLDALAHAVETAVTTARTPVSSLFAREAFVRIVGALPRVLAASSDLEARAELLIAATLAGVAIEHSMLGAAHSMANPLTAHHDVPHGQAVSTVLPLVVAFNADDPATARIYADLARAASLVAPGVADDIAVAALIATLERFLELAGFSRSLAAHGVAEHEIPLLAEEAAHQWTAQFNPRAVDVGAFHALFTAGSRRTQGA